MGDKLGAGHTAEFVFADAVYKLEFQGLRWFRFVAVCILVGAYWRRCASILSNERAGISPLSLG